MAAYDRKEADGSRWFYYRMDPSDLAVHADRDGRVTLLWKGGLDVNNLAGFFERAAKSLCGGNCRYHLSFATDDGLKEYDLRPGEVEPLPGWLTGNSGFVQFECLQAEDFRAPGQREPIILVYAYLDSRASNIDDLQQSIGVDLPQRGLDELEREIARIITSSSSEFFGERRYSEELVVRNLREVQGDLNRGLLLG